MKLSVGTFFLVAAASIFGIIKDASAITFGEPDNGEHPYTGSLLYNRGGGFLGLCTVTLINPTTIVTAAHCVDGADPDNVYVRFNEDPLDGFFTQPHPFFAWLSHAWIQAEAIIVHPSWTGGENVAEERDLAIIKIQDQNVDVGFASLPSVGFLGAIMDDPGNSDNSFTSVGYGSHGEIHPDQEPFPVWWIRTQSVSSIVALETAISVAGEKVKYTLNPGDGKGGFCFGDSGGPQFYQDTDIMVSVTSFGMNAKCVGVGYSQRLDTQDSLDFITGHDY